MPDGMTPDNRETPLQSQIVVATKWGGEKVHNVPPFATPEAPKPEVKSFSQLREDLDILRSKTNRTGEETAREARVATEMRKLYDEANKAGVFRDFNNHLQRIEDDTEDGHLTYKQASDAVNSFNASANEETTKKRLGDAWKVGYEGIIEDRQSIVTHVMDQSLLVARANKETDTDEKQKLLDRATILATSTRKLLIDPQKEVPRHLVELAETSLKPKTETKPVEPLREEPKQPETPEPPNNPQIEELGQTIEELRQTIAGLQEVLRPLRPLPTEQANERQKPQIIKDAERQVFGAGQAFSGRWVEKHGLPARVATQNSKIEFSTANILTEMAGTGLNNNNYELAQIAIRSTPNEKFRIAAQNGMLKLLVMDQAMKAKRIDAIGNALSGEFGIKPDGIAQWLLEDSETRRALTLIFRLQGYNVPDDIDDDGNRVHDEISGLNARGILPSVGIAFSDFSKLRPDQIDIYLEAVRQAIVVDEGIVTDPGVVRMAYTIFRLMGFPEAYDKNDKLVGLIMKNCRNYPGLNNPDADLEYEDLKPFIEKKSFNDPATITPANEGTSLKTILEREGALGFALAMDRLGKSANLILGIEWADLNMIRDLVNNVADIRIGEGGYPTLVFHERQKTILTSKEYITLEAKRRLTRGTFQRLIDPRKISSIPPVAQLDATQQVVHGLKAAANAMGINPSKRK